jgi:hypothetical protein
MSLGYSKSRFWLASAAACILLVTSGCTQTADTAPADNTGPEKEFYSSKDRVEAIRAAALFTPTTIADTDILAGPAQKKKLFQLHMNDKVICDFDKPGVEKGGKTPKFDCKITRVESPDGTVQELTPEIKEEPVKVKFGASNKEVFAEVPATRLLWALGYYADAWFPVRVECHNCPDDPESGSGSRATRTFNEATIVRKFGGHKMYETGKEDEGWSWNEFEQLNGRPSYEKDGLKLIAAFLSHSDNKPPQQRLVCDDIKLDQTTHPFTTTCGQSKMLIQDVGATFGGGGLFTSNSTAKMNLNEWSGNKLWKQVGSEVGAQECHARLRKSLAASGGLDDPTISEEGRRFTAGLMCQLSDKQIEDLFRVSRVAEMPEYHNGDGSFKSGMTEASILQQWVAAFKQKREDLAKGRCRWKTQPPDLAVIDNPMHLSTVPNNCSAKPF